MIDQESVPGVPGRRSLYLQINSVIYMLLFCSSVSIFQSSYRKNKFDTVV